MMRRRGFGFSLASSACEVGLNSSDLIPPLRLISIGGIRDRWLSCQNKSKSELLEHDVVTDAKAQRCLSVMRARFVGKLVESCALTLDH